MGLTIKTVKGSVGESVAGTAAHDQVEVADDNAKAVAIMSASIRNDSPAVVASTITSVAGLIRAGYYSSGNPYTDALNLDNVVSHQLTRCASDATPLVIQVWHDGDSPFKGPLPIPRNPDDKKFYITASVQGNSNAAVKGLTWTAVVAVET